MFNAMFAFALMFTWMSFIWVLSDKSAKTAEWDRCLTRAEIPVIRAAVLSPAHTEEALRASLARSGAYARLPRVFAL